MTAPRCTLDPACIVRIAGIPLGDLETLRFAQTNDLIEMIEELNVALASEGQALSALIYGLIGGQEDVALRRQLINVRRAVFQGVAPKPAWLTSQLWAALPPELPGRLQAWIGAEARRQALLACGPELLAEDWRAAYGRLRELAAREPFQQGLLLANRELFEAMRKWRAGDPATAPERALMLGLTQYLGRSAAKTSPYSSFTSFATAQWVEDGPAIVVRAESFARCSALQLNRWVLNQIAGALLHWPELRPHLPMTLNSSLVYVGEQLQFVTWRRGESVVRVAASPTVRLVVVMMRDLHTPTYGAVVATLAAIDGGERHAVIAHYLDQLIESGLLQIDIGIPEQASDYLGTLAARLRAYTAPALVRIGTLLQTLHVILAQYAAADQVTARRALLDQVEAQLKAIDVECRARGHAINLPTKHLFYEETLIPELDVQLSRMAWGAALEDLALVQGLSALFDPCLPARIVIAARFRARFGSGASVPLLDAYVALQPDAAAPDWLVGVASSGLVPLAQLGLGHEANLPQLAALHAAQTELLSLLRQDDWDRPILQLDRAALGAFLDRLPAWVAPAATLACYVQTLPGPLNQLVLNAVQSGKGRNRGRWLRMLQQRGAAPDATFAAPPAADGPLEADLAGIFTSTLSLRVSPYVYEICYPGYVSDRPQEQQIALQDLRVLHDPAAGRLRLISQRLGREVCPVHQSMLGESWLPPLYRFLLRAFGCGPVDPSALSLSALVRPARLAQVVRPDPRVALGAVIVDRARWVVPVHELPIRSRGEDQFAFLLRFQRWRRDYGIPSVVYLRLLGSDKYRKPLFLNFASGLALLALERAHSRADGVLLFQEALPAPQQLQLFDGEHGYVSEYVIELNYLGGA